MWLGRRLWQRRLWQGLGSRLWRGSGLGSRLLRGLSLGPRLLWGLRRGLGLSLGPRLLRSLGRRKQGTQRKMRNLRRHSIITAAFLALETFKHGHLEQRHMLDTTGGEVAKHLEGELVGQRIKGLVGNEMLAVGEDGFKARNLERGGVVERRFKHDDNVLKSGDVLGTKISISQSIV